MVGEVEIDLALVQQKQLDLDLQLQVAAGRDWFFRAAAMAMNSLSMVEARLPPGFRFHPRDDELVLDYLAKKLGGGGDGGAAVVSIYGCPTMVDVDLNKCEPWDLPGKT